MMLPKRQPVRSRKLRDHAHGQPCAHCGSNDGTTVLAHYTGLRQHAYGKGRGQKADDHMAAELCADCHAYFDAPANRKSEAASEAFLHAIAVTWRRWIDDGLITITGQREAGDA